MFIPQSYPLAIILCIVTMLCWGSWGNTQKMAGKAWRFELFYWEILLVAAMAIAGMAVAFPVGVGIALALGVIVNYVFVPQGNALWLFMGVALIVAAIIIDAVAYKKHSASLKKVSGKGILLSAGAGVLMSLFYRFVASSMASSFEMPEAGKLTPLFCDILFAVGVVLSNFIFNYFIMKKPFDGAPLSFSDYAKGSLGVHLTGVLGGVIWNIGMAMSIIASGKAGFAISYGLGQGATLIAALWGVFIWKEFKGASKSVNNLIFLMFMAYLAGLGLLVYAGT
ncbi:MAG: multidrug DMT transporter permease [Bacteroidales bacterium]|nr:multidrug DMT transporter permease [Bacteroidales bacterium]